MPLDLVKSMENLEDPYTKGSDIKPIEDTSKGWAGRLNEFGGPRQKL